MHRCDTWALEKQVTQTQQLHDAAVTGIGQTGDTSFLAVARGAARGTPGAQ